MSGTTVSVDPSGALVLDDTGDHVTTPRPHPGPPPHRAPRPYTPSPRDLWLAGEIRRRTALELAVRFADGRLTPATSTTVTHIAHQFEAYLAGGDQS